MRKFKKTKKYFFSIVFLMLIGGLLFVGCKPKTKEEKVAKENLQNAKEDLAIAKKNANAEEWEAYKISTDSIIHENEIRIATLKVKIKKAGKSIDTNYQKNIEHLEQKNSDLKIKIETYKNDTNSDWQSFKREFNHDMDEIGKALKNITIDNKN